MQPLTEQRGRALPRVGPRDQPAPKCVCEAGGGGGPGPQDPALVRAPPVGLAQASLALFFSFPPNCTEGPQVPCIPDASASSPALSTPGPASRDSDLPVVTWCFAADPGKVPQRFYPVDLIRRGHTTGVGLRDVVGTPGAVPSLLGGLQAASAPSPQRAFP